MALIDVDVAIRAAVEYIEDWNHVPSMYHRRMLAEKFMALPTVDAVPVKHGRWIKMGHIEHTWLVSKCSVCGNQTIDAGTYCTNCGAKMDVKDGDGNG